MVMKKRKGFELFGGSTGLPSRKVYLFIYLSANQKEHSNVRWCERNLSCFIGIKLYSKHLYFCQLYIQHFLAHSAPTAQVKLTESHSQLLPVTDQTSVIFGSHFFFRVKRLVQPIIADCVIDRQSSVKKPTRKTFQVTISSIFYPFTYVTQDNPG